MPAVLPWSQLAGRESAFDAQTSVGSNQAGTTV